MQAYENKEVEFFGKITAGSTHEMKNVLAIIRESSGLIEDLMALSREAPIPHREKFQKALATIKAQIQRGVEITDRLNRFAHSPDAEIARIDLAETSEQLITLARRFARLKNIALDTNPPKQPLAVVTRPIRLLMALFGCLECCLNAIPPGSRIVVHPQKKGEAYALYIACEGDFSSLSDHLSGAIAAAGQWPDMERTVVSLGGSVELEKDGPGVWLMLPEAPP
jgi:C4-dicarboxylate-specific signal transduction histidine kinase